ncbi:MurR/RpiR family transcriptional regulator [Aquibacillus sediminis]|uniref:MurR/RpiR family transcriptional regulator n=1 Tax=Aquibacillus sediminis TaxID=2574734 RepID=UPI0011099616|nr:MurR/RpiR family transcriptional regulator [Aquibacillus sediminis]
MDGVIYKVRESLNYVKPSARSVAEYIIQNPDEVVSMTVQELAEKTYTSAAAVMRYCQSLGFKGFKDFKLKLSGDLTVINLHEVDKDTLEPGDSIDNIMTVITNNNIQSLHDTLHLLNQDQLKKAYNYLVDAKKIDFYGVGSSYLIAYDAIQKFTRINKICSAFSDFHMQKVSAINLSDQDVAVAISYSGETPHIIDCVKIAQSRGAKVIAITKYADTSLSKMADAVLFVAAKEDEFRSAAMTSRIAQLNVIDMLYTACAHEEYESTLSHLNRTHQVIQQSKKGGN